MEISGRRLVLGLCALGALLLIAILLVPNRMYVSRPAEQRVAAFMGGGGGGGDREAVYRVASTTDDGNMPRQVIQTGSLDLLVEKVQDAASRIEALVRTSGGYVDSSNFSDSSDEMRSGQMTVRVPAGRLPDVRVQIKGLALRVENERTEARDVTKQFVDSEARLRNYKAEEAQYLEIMKRATTVKDTVEVTEKLSDVRGQIEELQGELNYLSHQVEMATITINLRSEREPGTSPVNWRPLRQASTAWHSMLEGFADYGDAMIGLIFMLPVILLWGCTLALMLFVLWRLFRKFKKRLTAPIS